MTTPIPEWLCTIRAAIPHVHRAAESSVTDSADLSGAICRAVPMDGQGARALVLVVASDTERRAHTVLLLSPDVSLATARDVFLPQSVTGLSFELVAQTDLFGYVWHAQLDGKLGQLPEPLFARITAGMAETHALEPELAAGPPVTVEGDPRWGHKLAELARLRELTDSCTCQLVDGEPHLLVDPVSLVPQADGLAELEEFVLAIADAVHAGDMELPGWVLEALLADQKVTDAYREAGADMALRLLAQMWEHTLAAMPGQAEPRVSESLVWLRSSLLPASEPVASGSIVLRDRLLAGEVEHGHGCVRMMSRHRSAIGDGLTVVEVNGRLVQCITEGFIDDDAWR